MIKYCELYVIYLYYISSHEFLRFFQSKVILVRALILFLSIFV